MAKTQTRAITLARSAPAPVIRVQTPRVVVPKPKRRSGKRRSGGGGGGGLGSLMPIVAGAGVLGFLKKAGIMDQVPALPFVGRIGAVAIIAHLWHRNGGGQLARDVSMSAAAIAAYQLASKGEIDGEDDELGSSLHACRGVPYATNV